MDGAPGNVLILDMLRFVHGLENQSKTIYPPGVWGGRGWCLLGYGPGTSLTLSSMRRRGLIVRKERSRGRELPWSGNPDLGSPFSCGTLMRRKPGKRPASAFFRGSILKEDFPSIPGPQVRGTGATRRQQLNSGSRFIFRNVAQVAQIVPLC